MAHPRKDLGKVFFYCFFQGRSELTFLWYIFKAGPAQIRLFISFKALKD